MKRLRLSPKSLFISLIVVTILCSPSFDILFYKFQFAALPESWYLLAVAVRGISSVALWFWFWVALLSPLACLLLLPLGRKVWLAPIALWAIAWCSAKGWYSYEDARQNGLVFISERGKPIIDAIEKYHADKGKYPANLQALVPAYLNEIPYTGVVGYPEYKYALADDTAPELKDEFSKKYQVCVPLFYLTPFDRRSDEFIYWPEKQCPYNLSNSSLDQIGDWVYSKSDSW